MTMLAVVACRDDHDAPANTAATAANPWADTGRVIDQGIASYAIIADTICPGTRLVQTHFAAPRDLIVRMTESSLQRDCMEGARTEFTVAVRDRNGALIQSISGGAHDLRVIDDDDADGDPLLQGDDYGGGSGPRELRYWTLRTGKAVFESETPLHSFVANGKLRYLAASGGNGDTLGVVVYGDARGNPQRVVFTRALRPGTKSGANYQVERDTLEGPRVRGRVVLGAANDSVAIRGITLRFTVGDVYLETGGLDIYDLAATIIDDRLVALPTTKHK
jgi:hypothetical protein